VKKTTFLKTSVFGAAAVALMALSSSASAQSVGACLITKTDTNPFFVKMKEGAMEAAKAKGAKLMSAAGKFDGDNATQITAIENRRRRKGHPARPERLQGDRRFRQEGA